MIYITGKSKDSNNHNGNGYVYVILCDSRNDTTIEVQYRTINN